MVNAVDQRFQEELIDRCLTTVPLTEEIGGSKIMISGEISCIYYPPRVPNYIRHGSAVARGGAGGPVPPPVFFLKSKNRPV